MLGQVLTYPLLPSSDPTPEECSSILYCILETMFLVSWKLILELQQPLLLIGCMTEVHTPLIW